jgi:hypothetical protein
MGTLASDIDVTQGHTSPAVTQIFNQSRHASDYAHSKGVG